MELWELVSQIKEQNTIIKEPVRLRRKLSKANTATGSKRGRGRSPEALRREREAKDRWWKSVGGSYAHLRKTYRSRAKAREAKGLKPIEFLLTEEDYKRLWEAAGFVRQADESPMPLWSLRGKRKGDARMYRIDDSKPWQLDNCIVLYRGQIYANGRKL